jgi:hypothetical protein
MNYTQAFDGAVIHSDYANRWQKPGDEFYTDVPSIIYSTSVTRDNFYANSTAKVEKAGHIRLQYVNVSYEFPTRILQKINFRSLEVYTSAANLGILWRANKKGLDPEFSELPQSKSLSIGIRTNF